jgi:hypothetical protein
MRHGWRLILCLGLLCSASKAADGVGGAPRVAPATPSNAVDAALADALEATGILARTSALVGERVSLPQPVSLRLVSCDQANAWYQPDTREVRLCLELARHLSALLGRELDDEAQLLQALDGALRFVLLHEIGHAVVDLLALPITGREEDAVDQFAVWLLLDAGDSTAVLSAASVFGQAVSGEADVAAAHSLDPQRYFNMLCWVYGRDPEWRLSLVEDWLLPASRALACEAEYAQLGRSWSRLLAAHRPQPASAAAASPPVPDKPSSPLQDLPQRPTEAPTAPPADPPR